MSDIDPLKTAKDGISVVGEIIKAAGSNEQVKEAASNLGQTAVTITKTINNALLPLAAVNFAFDKAKTYFSQHFQQDLSAKAENIPPENLVEPKASVAGPTLQGLAFTHEEPNLKEMYLNLLATAMDNRIAQNAHPAFVEIIKQLDSEDARLIKGALQSTAPIAIVQIHRKSQNGGYHILVNHLLNLQNTVTGQSIEDPRLAAMIDNWIRLGLVTVEYDKHLNAEEYYSWVKQRPEFTRLTEAPSTDGSTINFQKGILQRSNLGVQFACSVGLA